MYVGSVAAGGGVVAAVGRGAGFRGTDRAWADAVEAAGAGAGAVVVVASRSGDPQTEQNRMS